MEKTETVLPFKRNELEKAMYYIRAIYKFNPMISGKGRIMEMIK